jgi:hypothetical protein
MRMPRTAAAVWPISTELILALDERLGTPVDSYVNGSQTWLVDDDSPVTLEFRLHPVAAYRAPTGCSPYDLWEAVVAQLSGDADPHALRIGDDTRQVASLWDGLECFAAYGDDVEPARLSALATDALGVAPARCGLVDHDVIGDRWEQTQGKVSIVALLLEQLES